MRVLQVCQRYSPHLGGLEEHVKNISERLTSEYEVTIATTDPAGNLPKISRINDVEVIRFKSYAPGEAYFFSLPLRKYLMKNSGAFDVVHTHGYSTFTSVFAASAKGKNKLVFTPHYHGTGHTWFRALLHKPYKRFGKRIFQASDRIVCVSEYERKMMLRDFPIPAEKTCMIPNGVDLFEFEALEKNPHDRKLILYVGRLEKYKGVQSVIEVLPQLDSDFRLKIVGKGPYQNKLIRLAKRLNLEKRVSFLHDLSRSELLREYSDAGLFVLLSEYEAFGISVAESLCAGTPCIVANTSALSEWVDGENCFGVNVPIALSDLAEAIESAIGRRVQHPKVHDWSEITRELSNLYKNCIG